ncbi:MAG: hypothetical protein IAE80_02100 [Anaerolinea sp.]|nr:hypothetical protein [Anaerolinea sp.]
MFRFSALFLVLLAACSINPGAVDAIPPTATTVRVVQTTLVPTFERHIQPINTITPAPTTPIHAGCEGTAGLPGAQHTVNAGIDYEGHRVSVEQAIYFVNRTGGALTQIALDVEPNRQPNAFTLNAVTPVETVTGYDLTGRTLLLDLAAPLEPDCGIDLVLDFTLIVPTIDRGLRGFSGYFGYSIRQLNLGHWLAAVAYYTNGAWVTHDVFAIGEQTVNEIADWDVTLTVTNAPPNMVVAAPGTLTRTESEWRFVQTNAREFTASLSPFFNVYERETPHGVTVQLYAFGENQVGTSGGTVSGSAQALDAAANALATYSDLFGVYPNDRFIVVQGDFPDGMEFSDLVFVSNRWFEINPGSADSFLTFITVHEVSHQWWYGRVGSDQALNPWLDEALATYSELIFYQEFFPDLVDWWWDFRVNQYVGGRFNGNRVDATVYQFGSIRDYINAVYLRGAMMLDQLRIDLGDDVFFDWLRRYAETGADSIVTPDALWNLLTPEQLELISTTREQYLAGE